MTEIIQKRKIVFSIIGILLGLMFLFSAFSKTIPIGPFIEAIYDRFSINYQASAILARAIIGFEAGIGILFLLGINGRWRWVLYASLGLLIAFTFFILGIWYIEGNEADCGCLGEVVKLSPFWSIIKNLVMITLVLILIIKDRRIETKAKQYFAWIITAVFIIYPFIFVPGELKIDLIYPTVANDSMQTPSIDLRTGKHLVAFMSLTCKHCLKAATKMAEMHKEDPNIPIIFIFPQPNEVQLPLVDSFIQKTHSQDIPKHFIPMYTFRELAGKAVPSIYMINDKNIEDKIDNYKIIKTKELQDWYR